MKLKLLFILIAFHVLSGSLFAQDKASLTENKNWSNIDTTKHSVPLNEFMVYQFGNYELPILDRKVFVYKNRADQFFFNKEPVIAVEINGEVKAYPLSILRYYEILNDEAGGVPILLTYCSLCNSAIAFDRRLNYEGSEHILDFVYPKIVRQSNMVIKDKQTNTLWQQFEGNAVVGSLSGALLKQAPFVMMSYQDFFTNYPKGKILSPDSDPKMQFYKGYMMNPDVGYSDLNREPHFFTSKSDARLAPKEPVIVLKLKDQFFVYPFSILSKENTIRDNPAGIDMVIFYNPSMVSILDKGLIRESKDIGYAIAYSPIVKGKILKFVKTENGFKDTKTSSIWNMLGMCTEGKLKGEKLQEMPYSQTFAFVILAFHPNAVVFRKK